MDRSLQWCVEGQALNPKTAPAKLTVTFNSYYDPLKVLTAPSEILYMSFLFRPLY